MRKCKNNQNLINNILFAVLCVLFFSLISFGLYELENYELYKKLESNILFIVIFYVLLIIITTIIFTKGYKLICKFFNWNEEIELPEGENKKFNKFMVVLIFSIFMIDNMLELNNIEPIFLRIIARSSLAVVFLFISVRYVNKVIKNTDKK